jgi:endonuclease YncB( thermonuclease family)
VAGVQTDSNGMCWLQFFTDQKNIKFIPISNEGNECLARVYIERENEKTMDAGLSLIKLGFAQAVPFPKEIVDKDKTLISYFNRLKQNERVAKAARRGQWHTLPESWLRWKIRRTSENLLHQMKLSIQILPQMLRRK